MAAGDPDDILRSLRRYVWWTLGSKPWKVRVQRTRVLDDERPAAVVEESTPMSSPRSRAGTLNQGDVQNMQGFAVVCYPALGASAPEAAQEARRVRTLLYAGFSRGLVTDGVPPVNIGAPWRLPVYDFEGVPIVGPERAGPALPYMHANIDETFNVRAIQDPLDELRFTVVANLRVTWWAAGRIGPAGPIARDMPATAQVS